MNNNEKQQAEVRQQVSHDVIARRAEELWRQYGCPQGRDEEIWLEAERQLLGAQQQQSSQPTDFPSSGTFGGPQTPGAEADQIKDRPTTPSQAAELMKTPATTTAARSKSKKSAAK
jgi:hypothetical protein